MSLWSACGDQHLSAALGLLTRCLFIIAAPTACDRLSPAKLILMRAGDTITDPFRYLGLGVRCDVRPSSIIKPRGRGLEPVRRWQAPLNDDRSQVSREMRLLQSRKLRFIRIPQRSWHISGGVAWIFQPLSLHSPRGDVRGEADHKRSDEGADLLGSPQPPPLLLIQTFLPHTDKSTQAPLRSRVWLYRPGTHIDIVKWFVQVIGARPAAVQRVLAVVNVETGTSFDY